jgi:hypothetical protein
MARPQCDTPLVFSYVFYFCLHMFQDLFLWVIAIYSNLLWILLFNLLHLFLTVHDEDTPSVFQIGSHCMSTSQYTFNFSNWCILILCVLYLHLHRILCKLHNKGKKSMSIRLTNKTQKFSINGNNVWGWSMMLEMAWDVLQMAMRGACMYDMEGMVVGHCILNQMSYRARWGVFNILSIIQPKMGRMFKCFYFISYL